MKQILQRGVVLPFVSAIGGLILVDWLRPSVPNRPLLLSLVASAATVLGMLQARVFVLQKQLGRSSWAHAAPIQVAGSILVAATLVAAFHFGARGSWPSWAADLADSLLLMIPASLIAQSIGCLTMSDNIEDGYAASK